MHLSRFRAVLAISGSLLGIGITIPTPSAAQRVGAATHAAAATAARGTLFIVGGGPQPPALVQHFVDLAGGKRAKIVVFAMANSDGQANGEEKAADLRKLGAEATSIFVNNEQANTDSVAHLLHEATGIWFTGGDQVLLARALAGTKTLAAIRARYHAGAVVGGTSAGAAVMSTPMITGDEMRQGGLRMPSDTTDHFLTIARKNIATDDGFGLIRGAIVDQHFIRRKRNNRLLSLVLERPDHLGVGIDESTALVVHPNGRWTVEGESAAIVYDARHATITSAHAPVLGAAGIRMYVLPAGSTFNPATGTATLPAAH